MRRRRNQKKIPLTMTNLHFNFATVHRVEHSITRRTWQQVLDTQAHPPQGSVNTCLPCFACGAESCGSSPSRLNRLDGSFTSVNRETASCHSGAGTWVALLRGMLSVGYARNSQLTGQQQNENVSPLNPDAVPRTPEQGARGKRLKARGQALGRRCKERDEVRRKSPQQDSEDCGFPFALFLFRLVASQFFLRGTCFCFLCSLFFLLRFLCA